MFVTNQNNRSNIRLCLTLNINHDPTPNLFSIITLSLDPNSVSVINPNPKDIF